MSGVPNHLINTKRIVALYRAGKSMEEIAKIEGCSINTAWNRLKDAGVQSRPASHRIQQFRAALAHLQAKP